MMQQGLVGTLSPTVTSACWQQHTDEHGVLGYCSRLLFTECSPTAVQPGVVSAVKVFAAVIVGSLAQDQHIGTRLQVS
jgi:hypothetical protein